MSYAAAATVGAAALSYQSQQNNASAQNQANRMNAGQTKAQRAAEKLQFEREAAMGNERGQSKRDYMQPLLGGYNAAGNQATQQQSALMGLQGKEAATAAMENFNESPGQKFIRERAQKGLLRNSAAIGGLGGGNVRTALVEQGTGFAQQDFGNYMQRLQGLSGQGIQAGQQMVGADQGVSDTAGGMLAESKQAAADAAAKKEADAANADRQNRLRMEREDKTNRANRELLQNSM